MKSLNVKIESRFKPGLSERFDAKNARFVGSVYVINIPCPLCVEYCYEQKLQKKCEGCPFKNFGGAESAGCYEWIRDILNGENRVFSLGVVISWALENDKKARAQLTLLRKEAEKWITWINTGECKACGMKLIAKKSKKAGYCSPCVTSNENAKKAWKKLGTKYCSKCGNMLHDKRSIKVGVCTLCRKQDK